MKKKPLTYNLVLIGFMGSGKSTVAKHLRRIYQMEIVEMDRKIEQQEGMSISEIFAQYGEEYFRNLETRLLIEMQEKQNVIISCGGGVPLRECNVSEMKKNGKVVLLTARPETIFSRVKNSRRRPLLEGNMNVDYIRKLQEERREKYENAADIVISTDGKTIEQICRDLVDRIEEEERRV